MGLTHEDVVVNVDATCTIDIVTRKITPVSSNTGLSQYDHNSERIGFTMKRDVDSHDMSKSDRVAIKYLNVKKSDMYIVDDMTVSDDGEFITFTWLVSGNATQEVGSLVFLINFRCYSDDGTITYNWSTQPCSTYTINKVTGWGKIVENFEIMLDDINAEIVHQGLYIRQSIGQFHNGDYCVCTVDMSRNGVENEAGITYEALAQLFVDRGVKFAYSLDGGGSAETVIGKRQLNPIYEGTGGRAVPTVITFEIAD